MNVTIGVVVIELAHLVDRPPMTLIPVQRPAFRSHGGRHGSLTTCLLQTQNFTTPPSMAQPRPKIRNALEASQKVFGLRKETTILSSILGLKNQNPGGVRFHQAAKTERRERKIAGS